MADPLAIVDHIIQLVLAIKTAVETVRENKEECSDIQRRVFRIKVLLSILKKSEMMKHQAMSDALEDLGNALSRALDVVKACQARSILCRFCAPGKQAKKLRQVRGDISETMMVAMFTTNVIVFVEPESNGNDEELDLLSEHLPASPPPSTVVGEDQLCPPPSHVGPSTSIAVDVSDADLPPNSPEQNLSPPHTIVPPAPSKHLRPHLSTQQQQQQQQKQTSPPTSPISKRKPPYYPPTEPPSSPPHHPRVKLAPLSNDVPPYPPTQPSSPPPPPPLSEHRPPYTPTQPPPPPIKVAPPPPPKHLPSQPPTKPPATSTPSTSKISPPSEYLHPHPIIAQPLPPPPPPPHPQSPLHPYIPSKKTTRLPGHARHPQTSTHLPRHSPTKSTSEVSVPAFVSSALSTDDVRKHSHLTNGTDKSEEKYERKEALARSSTVSSHLPGLTKFSFSNLKAATHNFSNGKMIGSSDCTVYEGQLHNGVMVAVKKFRNPARSLVARWSTELHLASKLQSMDPEALGNNKYIVRVLGYGHEFLSLEPYIFLVEEYMPNGTMGDIIYGSQSTDWSSRFGIIQGLAHGLHYLHGQNIVHMNVKPDNILLDIDMNPKITDFGIARMLKQPVVHDDNISGTLGYMPPEYILEGILSIWYDVYSFGVTLLETISGMCRVEPARHHASVPWAWNVRKSQEMGELFHPSMFEESQMTEINRCLEIGLLCTQFEWTERPTMAEVLDMLNVNKGLLRTPKRPQYTKERGTTAKGSSHKGRSWR
ncbi:unnamed protein product [Urochloa decumbens]|uniref:Protein kinase domain-containing protein n=1 Tax=Urochloa decumbens TaxID=240449 RepID=A0ABC9AN32_9POAL